MAQSADCVMAASHPSCCCRLQKEDRMRQSFLRAIGAMSLIVAGGSAAFALADPPTSLSRGDRQALEKAVAAPTRTPANSVRDKYRNPVQTLSFFGVRPNHTVVEMWPGG